MIMQHERIRWGIVGCGNVTEVKSGPAFQQVKHSELVAVMRRNPDLVADYARRHNVPRWYTDAQDLIADESVDAVYIATPVGSHCEMALAVCKAGKPCYVEKPMARHYRECQQMVKAFAEVGLPLFVAYYRRGLPRFLKVKELVQTGELGQLESVSVQYAGVMPANLKRETLSWRWQAEEAGGGLFLDLGSHTLDVLDFILGPLEYAGGEVCRRSGDYDVEDRVAFRFSACKGTVKGDASWDFRAPARLDSIMITGSAGRVSLSSFGDEPVRLETTRDGVRQFDLPNPRHIQQPLIQSIVDEMLGRGTCSSTGVSAARTSRLMDQVLDEYYCGRDDAFWRRPQTWNNPLR